MKLVAYVPFMLLDPRKRINFMAACQRSAEIIKVLHYTNSRRRISSTTPLSLSSYHDAFGITVFCKCFLSISRH